MEEIDKTVEERPATHKKKAQYVAMAMIGVLIVLLIIATVKRLGGGSQVASDEPGTTRQAERLTPEQQNVLFENRLSSAEKDLEREKKNKFRGEETGDLSEYELTIAKLQKELAEQKAARNAQANYPNYQNSGSGQKPQKTWRDLELERVRNARYAGTPINLGFKDNSADGRVTSVSSVPSARPVRTRSDAAIAAEQRLAEYEAAANRSGAVGSQGGVVNGFGSIPSDNGPPVIGRASSEQPLGPKVGQYLLSTGMVITAALDQRSISDYTGSYRCRIANDVYDVTKRFILIPKGAVCTGKSIRISNVNEPIQSRMGLNVEWVVLPDGRRISFKSQGMLDHEGINAIKGKVDRHLFAQFLGVAAYALVAKDGSYNTDNSVSYEGRVDEGVRDKGGDIANKYLNLVPTIELDYGTPLRIFIEEEMYIYPWRRVGDQYLRG